MQLVLAITLLASLITSVFASPLAGRQECAEASRFGIVQIAPSTLKPGDPFTMTATFNCSAYFGIHPVSIDYLIEVPAASNNGYEPVILLARHAFPTAPSGQFPKDQFNGTLPTYGGFQAFPTAPWSLLMLVTYPVDNGDGTSTLIQGGIYGGLNITVGN